jgi:hypothetical protein
MARRTEKRRPLDKRGYVLGGGESGPRPTKLPPVKDPGPGAGAKPKKSDSHGASNDRG